MGINTSIPVMTATVGGTVPTPPNDATKFLNGIGLFSTPAGGGTGGSFTEAFTAQTSVVVTHNLGAYPVIDIIDSGLEVIIPLTIIHSSVNAFTVTFTASTTGTIIATLGIGSTGVTGTGTINELSYWNSSTSQATLAVATYPSLTEIAYVKGVTSAIQTQLNAKGVGTWTDSSTNTGTNKRITKRVTTEASSATPTINTDNSDEHGVTALTVAITSMSSGLSGTPTDGQVLFVRITGTAARAITWGASFAASDVSLPTTTSGTKTLVVAFKIISAVSSTVWQCMASNNVGT